MNAGYAVEAEPEAYQKQPQKKKKIGFFKKWFAKMCREAWESERRGEANLVGAQDVVSLKASRLTVGPAQIDQPERAIQFTVYNANGGRVIETRRYDKKTDRSSNGLYIITNDQDFGREIDKIITMEALK